MVQEITLDGKKRMALIFEQNEDLEDLEIYRKGLLDLVEYASMMIDEDEDLEFEGAGWGIRFAVKLARMLEKE